LILPVNYTTTYNIYFLIFDLNHILETLSTVIMSGNMIDDDLLRMLMTGLIKNNTITHLDVSHNKITNHGARLLSKMLDENSVLTSLNVSDNQIHVEGGRLNLKLKLKDFPPF
jgi:Ran GTPase-activating protein (RanGAP) involved in mRNA processing and transport